MLLFILITFWADGRQPSIRFHADTEVQPVTTTLHCCFYPLLTQKSAHRNAVAMHLKKELVHFPSYVPLRQYHHPLS